MNCRSVRKNVCHLLGYVVIVSGQYLLYVTLKKKSLFHDWKHQSHVHTETESISLHQQIEANATKI